MAVVLPLLVFLVCGILDLSRMLNAKIELSQAAREGVRLAALSESNPTYPSLIASRVAAAAPNPAFQSGAASVIGTPTICAEGIPLAYVTVGVHFTGILWRAGSGIDLQETAVMRCGG